MALGFIIGFVVGAVVVMYFMAAPLMRLSEDERNDIVRKIQAAGWRNKKPAVDSTVQLRPYKMPKKVIEYYDEAYPYLVVAEKPNSTEVEYWWAGDKDVKDLQHSCIADKYVQLCYFVKSNTVREAHG